jgi:hypothetical protein
MRSRHRRRPVASSRPAPGRRPCDAFRTNRLHDGGKFITVRRMKTGGPARIFRKPVPPVADDGDGPVSATAARDVGPRRKIPELAAGAAARRRGRPEEAIPERFRDSRRRHA